MSSGLKVEFKKFDGKRSFSMWKTRMENLLAQLGLDLTLKERSEDMWIGSGVSWKRGHVR